jgi:hypothetical protein
MVLTSQKGSETNLMNDDVRGSRETHRAGRRHDLARNEETGLPTRKRSLMGNPAKIQPGFGAEFPYNTMWALPGREAASKTSVSCALNV